MVKRLTLLLVAVMVLLSGSQRQPPYAAELVQPLMKSMEPPEICLMPPLEYGAEQSRAGQIDGPAAVVPSDWPGKGALGGDVAPIRMVNDLYPTYDGIAVDPENGLVVMSDENRSSLLIYDRASGGGTGSKAMTEPRRQIMGPHAKLGFVAGVTLDPKRREAFVTNNDGGGLVVFSYDSHGDARPIRGLDVPHQSWGLSLDLARDELAVTSQQYQGISFFPRMSTGATKPVRTIRGMDTKLADPHGVFFDGAGDEVIVANHGNWTEMRSYAGDEAALPGEYIPGRFEQPSLRVYKASANGNVPPIRTIQGKQTKLAWPMGITLDVAGNEVVVANYGSNEILFFSRVGNGDLAPSRVLGGSRTGIVGPIGVGVDSKNNELWVANYGDHTAVVFDRTASGNVEPKRIVRNAPAGTPTTGFTNASAAAYDNKRREILVPN